MYRFYKPIIFLFYPKYTIITVGFQGGELMNSPKIVVLRLRDILYTLLFAALGLILILALVFMFKPKDKNESAPTMTYTPGIYTSAFLYDQQVVNVEVTIYDDKVQSVQFLNLDPNFKMVNQLFEPAMSTINDQLRKKGTEKEVKPDDQSKETTAYIMTAVNKALEKARIEP